MAKVLVVDDRPVNRDLVRTLLSHRGHQVVEAGDGAEALSLARREPPDLVITDVLMPGMDGCELVRALRELPDTAHIPVIFYTANYLEDEVRPIADAYGVASVLPKTSDPQVVLATVDRLLGDTSLPPLTTPDPEAIHKHLQTVNAKLVEKVRELEAKEEALRESEERFRSMAESAPVGLFLGDAEARAVYVNPRFAEIVGRAAEDLRGHGWREHVGFTAAGLDTARTKHGSREPPRRQRCRAVRPDGSDLWLDVSLSVVRDGDGQQFATIGMIDDVTSVVEAETRKQEMDTRLQVTERLEGLGRLAGGVAHDFNNILTVILAYAKFAQAASINGMQSGLVNNEIGTALLDDLDRVLQAGNRASNLTAQLLTFGRRDMAQPSVVDLNTVLRGIAGLLERTLGEHIEIVSSLDRDLWPICADSSQLSQIVLNLAVNARDAMPSGGLLTLRTANIETQPSGEPGDADLSPGRYVRLTVSDTGHGMPPHVMERALDPFFTTKPPGEGTGLGLASVYGIVTRSGGRLVLRSTVGQGTGVDILIPAADAAIRPSNQQADQEAEAPGGTETILVIDDESSIGDISRRILARAGYQVSTYTSAQAAIDTVVASQQHVDLLLTDVVMPRMSGPDLARRMKALQPDTRVLFMSGYADALLDAQGALAPDITILSKPFSAPALLRTVRAVLDDAPGALQ